MLPEGEYILRAWCNRTPHIVIEKTLQLYPALSEEPLKETGPLLPLDPQKDASVWEALSIANLVQEARNGKGRTRIFIYPKSTMLKAKAASFTPKRAAIPPKRASSSAGLQACRYLI
mgnify:CR=1 FL=1